MIGLRMLRWVLAPFFGLAVVFVVGNLVLEQVAEDQVASRVQRSFDLPRKPSVNITAFPIVVRLLQHRVPAVSVTASDVAAGGLRLRALRVSLSGIDAGFDVLGDPRAALRVEAARAVAEATDDEVNAFLEREDVEGRVTFTAGGPVVRATPVIAGRRREVVARGRLSLRRGALRFAPTRVTVDGRAPDPRVAERARRAASFSVRLPRLPGGFVATDVEVADGVGRLVATVRDYRLRLSPDGN